MIRIGIWEDRGSTLDTTVFLQHEEDGRFVALNCSNSKENREIWRMDTTVMELNYVHELTRVPL